MDKKTYPVVIQKGESGKYIASCPSIEGCYSQGDTIAEALMNIQEAIILCLEVMRDRGEPPPEPATTILGEVVVEV